MEWGAQYDTNIHHRPLTLSSQKGPRHMHVEFREYENAISFAGHKIPHMYAGMCKSTSPSQLYHLIQKPATPINDAGILFL